MITEVAGEEGPQGDAVTSGHADEHLVPLPGTEWAAWRYAVLRSAGFPAVGLDRFAAPAYAAAADAFLDGRAGREELEAAGDAAHADARRVAAEIAADPLFREAVTWQNPGMLTALAGGDETAPAGKKASRLRQKRRARDDTIARYWQRYCGKNDTIGFFGPVSWATLDPDAPAVRVRCGEGLLRARQTCYEFWALQAYVEHVAADPVVRPWLPVGLHPHVMLDGRRVLRPGQAPLPLSRAEADLLSRCDGIRPAAAVAGGPDREEALVMLESLATQGVVWWGVDMPQDPGAEQVLRSTLAAIQDPDARERALSGLRRLDAARAGISAAAGDADKLATAVSILDAEFSAVTGEPPARRPGQMYAGRRLYYEDTIRDIDVTFGGPILEALAGPLGAVLLPAARWLSAALAQAYSAAFGSLYAELLEPAADGVPLDRFWAAAQPLFNGGELPADDVAAEFARRWAALFDLDRVAPGTSRVTVSSAEVAGRAAELFPAARPGWTGARIHSPDLHICATSAAALGRGEFTIVLGEMHATWATMDCALFTDRHPDPAKLRAAAAADIGPQLRPAYQNWCAQFTPRISPNLGVTDYQLAFAAAPGADRARLLPVMALRVTEHDRALVVADGDGRRWPLLEVFALLIAWLGSELFDPASATAHSPRITIDRMVAARETWRTTVGRSGLTVRGRLCEYLAARRLRREHGLPERVFAKIGTETKPVYVDWTSPRYVSAFATMLRTARQTAGDDVEVVITEMLPTPEQAWLPDAQGQRYCSELRIQLRDPVPANGIAVMEEQ